MNKEDCQIKIAQYTRGFSDGKNRSAAKNASGSCSEFYSEGFDDASTARSAVLKREPSTLLSKKETSADDLALLEAMRSTLAGLDDRLSESDVYRAISEAGETFMHAHVKEAAQREIASAVVDELERRAAAKAAKPSE